LFTKAPAAESERYALLESKKMNLSENYFIRNSKGCRNYSMSLFPLCDRFQDRKINTAGFFYALPFVCSGPIKFLYLPEYFKK